MWAFPASLFSLPPPLYNYILPSLMVNLNCQQNIELFKRQISGYIYEGISKLVYLRLGDVPYVNSSAPWADVLGGLHGLMSWVDSSHSTS